MNLMVTTVANLRRALIGLCLVIAGSVAVADTTDPGRQLDDIVEEYYEQLLAANPLLATFNGDHRFDDRWVVDIAPAHRQASLERERRFLARVEALPSDTLSGSDRLTRELFVYGRRQAIAGAAFPDHLLPVDQFSSTPIVFAMLGSGRSVQPFETVQDYENWLQRMAVWPNWIDQAIANMREGIERGVVQPRILMQRALPLLEAQIVDSPTKSPFWQPIERMPETFPPETRAKLARRYAAAIRTEVIDPYERLRDFVREVYLPRTRKSVGLSAQPDGVVWYRFLVRAHTTTDLTPQEIHRIGQAEVRRLEVEIARVRDRPDRGTGRSTAYGPLLDGYRSLRGRVEQRLPLLFSTVPEANFEVRPVEAFRRDAAAGASYMPASPDGTRPGVFYVNADESAHGTPSEALFLHEAIPGHHFQLSLQREREALPRFRRFGRYTAYTEGWALYVERLGQPLGLYRDRGQQLRALNSELFRARRLVVDTGLHAMGWTRRQAIDFIGNANEVDRYIALPGQALAYKLGQMRILDMRARAEQALEDRFDIRAFHDVVLNEGALPMDVLEAEVDRWIERTRSPSEVR